MVNIVPVAGNPKIKRCTDCNSFVSASNVSGHTAAECARRKANKGKRRAAGPGALKKKVRLTDKRRASLDKLLDRSPGLTEKQRASWKKRIYG